MPCQSIFDLPATAADHERALREERQQDELRMKTATSPAEQLQAAAEVARKWGLFQG